MREGRHDQHERKTNTREVDMINMREESTRERVDMINMREESTREREVDVINLREGERGINTREASTRSTRKRVDIIHLLLRI